MIIWPVGQAVKTPPSHGGIMGSSPVRVTNKEDRQNAYPFLLFGAPVREVRRIHRVRKNASVYTRVFFFERSESPRTGHLFYKRTP